MYGVNVTRVNRSGMDLFADPNLVLQVGDRVMVVGRQDAVDRVSNVLGNQLKVLTRRTLLLFSSESSWAFCSAACR